MEAIYTSKKVSLSPNYKILQGPYGSVVVEALYYKPEGRRFDSRGHSFFFSIYLILKAALGPEVYSASNKNKYQKQAKMFLGSKARPVREAYNLTAISDCLDNVGSSTSHNPIGLHCLLQ
jgi:hypothetical protein